MVYKLILDEINGPELPPEAAAKLKGKLSLRRYDSIAELLLHLDADICSRLVIGPNAILSNLSLLDPACGSGTFLVAAMKTLINIYTAVTGKIRFLNNRKLTDWLADIEKNHASLNYYIKKQIITHNLYGVDIMEEACEIAKLRLFLTLVASVDREDQLEPLPNIDFNIMPGNSLIGLMRVDSKEFDNYDLYLKSYAKLVQEKNQLINAYKDASTYTGELEELRERINTQREEAIETLNTILGAEFSKLGIKYEQATWDNEKKKEGKPHKRGLKKDDLVNLHPFHWAFEFDEIFRKKNGFDAIITNPPWEIFKPQAKEFFAEYSDLVTKNKMSIKDFEKKKDELLEDELIRASWLEYESRFPFVSSYFRSSTQYENQIAVVNGKKAGTDINLYKLFTEQCFNLLHSGGYCGIVIPSGIYTDLGAKQLRQMLFDSTSLTGLFCFENRKEIFEGVHRSFKFVVLSFEKGGQTKKFPAAFMRHDVEELRDFPKNIGAEISIDFIRRQSPDSLSIMEMKNELEFTIVEKMMKFPMIGDNIDTNWKLRFNSELHITNDSHLFKSTKKGNNLKIFTGRNFNLFELSSDPIRYYLNEEEVAIEFESKIRKNGFKFYERYRWAFRRIARNTDSRTFINFIIPPNVLSDVNSIDVYQSNLTYADQVVFCALASSYTIDYYLRQTVTTTLNFFYVYQLPVPRLNPKNQWYQPIIKRAARLICTTAEYAELWEETMGTTWTEKSGATNEVERNKLRAELDGIVAHLYALTEEEFAYILTTFPLVPQPQKVAAHNAYRNVLTGIIK